MLKRNCYTPTSFYRFPLKVQVDMERALRCSSMVQSLSGKTVWTWMIYSNLILICGGEKCKETGSTAANLQGNNGDQTTFQIYHRVVTWSCLHSPWVCCQIHLKIVKLEDICQVIPFKGKAFPPWCDFYENNFIYTFRSACYYLMAFELPNGISSEEFYRTKTFKNIFCDLFSTSDLLWLYDGSPC